MLHAIGCVGDLQIGKATVRQMWEVRWRKMRCCKQEGDLTFVWGELALNFFEGAIYVP